MPFIVFESAPWLFDGFLMWRTNWEVVVQGEPLIAYRSAMKIPILALMCIQNLLSVLP
jgi:hypothetical protein